MGTGCKAASRTNRRLLGVARPIDTAPWPAGTFTNWLKTYKTYVLNDVVAPTQKLDDSLLMQFNMLNVSSTGFKSTGPLVGVRDYQLKAREMYGLRPRRVSEPPVVILQ